MGVCRFNEIVNVTSTNRQCALVNSQCRWCMFWFDWIHLRFLGQMAEKDNVIKRMKEEVGKKQLGIKKADLRVWLWLQFYFWVFVAQLWGILLVHKMTILWIHRGSEFGRKFQLLDHCQYFSVSWDWWKDLHSEWWYRTTQLTEEGVRQQKERVWWSRKAWKRSVGIVKSFTWRIFSGSWHLALFDLSYPFILMCTALLQAKNLTSELPWWHSTDQTELWRSWLLHIR